MGSAILIKVTNNIFSHIYPKNIYLNLYFHFSALVSRLSAALSSANQHATPPEFGRKWGS